MVNALIDRYIEVNKFGELIGMHFEILKDQSVVYHLEMSEKHLATSISAHGGVIASLMDGALGVASLVNVAERGKVVSTVELKLNFLAPAKVGDKLLAKAKVIQAGNRLIYTECTIANQDNVIVAKGSGTFNAYPSEKAII